jgi:protein-tyrosine phosphatase
MMIDLHCHIIPGIDDGAPTLEASLAMAEAAAKDGITIIVATPHIITGLYETTKQAILEGVERLNQIISQEGLPVEILPGSEVHIEPDLPGRIQDQEVLTINNTGRYLLVELPSAFVPDYTADVLYQIQLLGITPIIAHPERNASLMRNHAALKEMVVRGVLTQITSASITGYFGRRVRRTALELIAEGLGHMIATDGHAEKGRTTQMREAFQIIEKYWGTDIAGQMTRDIPLAVCKGTEVVLPVINERKKSPWKYCLASKLKLF